MNKSRLKINTVTDMFIRNLRSIILFISLVLLLCPSVSICDTSINNNVDTDTLWTKVGSPYLVHPNIKVLENVTLKIEPGVRIVFDSARSITVLGKLIASGTPSERITFTGANATQGYWTGLIFNPNSAGHTYGSSLIYTDIEYAGRNNGNIYISDSTVDMANCKVSNSLTSGIYIYTKGIANISETQLLDNKTNAVYYYSISKTGPLSNLTASGNGIDAVVLRTGYISDAQVWKNCGLPYFVVSAGEIDITAKGRLEIEAGCTVIFDSNSSMVCAGSLYVNGLEDKQILFTGKEKTPGFWKGLKFQGVPIYVKGASVTNNLSRLEYLNIEYGGGTATYKSNMHIYNTKVYATHCTFKYSAYDGISAYNSGGTVIEFCKISDNANKGLGTYNTTTYKTFIIAANNWWGDASGPYNLNCNPSGNGNAAGDYVAFFPFQKSADENPELCSPTDSFKLALTPLKWFAPADNINPVYVKITLRDGAGNPLPGYKAKMTSTIGTVTDGGLTDINGECYAIIKSKVAGKAVITAQLDSVLDCTATISQSAEITFTTDAQTDGALLNESAAPYINNSLSVSPMPITQGVLSKISAKMSNPYEVPIFVDATFEIAQYGIGIMFGPIGTVDNFRIEPNTSSVIEVPWTPLISGHYCVKMSYFFDEAPTSKTLSALLPKAGGSGKAQKNFDIKEAEFNSDNEESAIDKARKAINFITSLPILPKGLNVPAFLFNKLLNWQLTTAEQIGGSLQGNENTTPGNNKAPTKFGNDEPGDYKQTNVPPKFEPPTVEPGDWYKKDETKNIGGDSKKISAVITPAEADALNAFFQSMADVIFFGRAYIITTLRYQDAVQANDKQWYCIQASAAEFYKREFGKALINSGNNFLAIENVMKSEGYPDIMITPEYIEDYQTTLTLTGFSAEDIQEAHNCGLTDLMLDNILVTQLALDPNTKTGSFYQWMTDVSMALGDLGLMYSGIMFPSDQITGGRKKDTFVEDNPSTNNLVRVYDTEMQFNLGNPLDHAADFTLSLRNIDIPADWSVSIEPQTVTLQAGEQVQATVKVGAGTASVQGTTPRIAVEGYAEGKLIGGVVMDIVVPEYRKFPLPPVMWIAH